MISSAKITLVSALLLSALLVQGCSKTALLKLTYENDRFVSSSESLCYNYASIAYEPASIGEAYAYCNDPEITLYEITGLNPTDWLTEEYAGTATTIFYNADLHLPALNEMKPNKMFVCLTGDRVFSLATVEDPTVIDEIIRVFYEGEETVWPLINSSLIYNLKFLSEKNAPGIYYNLIYGEFPEGNFLYDQGSGRCVEVGTLIQDIEV